jgi:carbon-monoxide dehydrogenase large subunit
MTVSAILGASIKRHEDPRLISGHGHYTDDVKRPGLTYAAFLRSPYAHARITSIDADAARAAPGVIAVATGFQIPVATDTASVQAGVADRTGGADVNQVIPTTGPRIDQLIPTAWLPPNCDLKVVPHPALAREKVRYVGDAVAVVVADTRNHARDALDLINVDYDLLPAVIGAEQALQAGAPQLHADAPDNQALRWVVSGGDAEAAFRDAEIVIRQRITNQRVIPNAMEPRAAVAEWDEGSNELTVWSTSQNPHIARVLMSAVTGIPEHKLRVISIDVGGGFGSKIPFYPEEATLAVLARWLKRPIKWTEERRENFQSTSHGRDFVTDLELAARRDGTVTALRGRSYANLGAYLSTTEPGVPTVLHSLIISGPYDIPNVDYTVYGAFTNTTPVDAYRGAGRPEATFLGERAMDLLADELQMDPAEVRRRNLIRADRFPYTNPLGLVYDSGNYEAALDKALQLAEYAALRREQAQAREDGRLMGVGVASYVEICGLGPSAVAGATGFQGGLWESALVRVHPTAKVTAFTGISPHGQGHETSFAQIIANELQIPVEDIEVVHGDTASVPMGWGTYGSRSAPVGGNAMALATRKVVAKATRIAAHMLEVAPEDVTYDAGVFRVKGAPDRNKTFAEVCLQAHLAWKLPGDIEPALEESTFFDPSNFVYPFGTHVCAVEIERDTGHVLFRKYVAVDDCGPLINPMLAEGQVHGGVAQGIGQALYEEAVYDDSGQLVSGTHLECDTRSSIV